MKSWLSPESKLGRDSDGCRDSWQWQGESSSSSKELVVASGIHLWQLALPGPQCLGRPPVIV